MGEDMQSNILGCIAGILTWDYLLYFLGYALDEKIYHLPFLHRFFNKEAFPIWKSRMKSRSIYLIFFSSYFIGLRIPFLLYAGRLKLPFLPFFFLDLLSVGIRVIVLVLSGYLSLELYKNLGFSESELITLVLYSALIGFLYAIFLKLGITENRKRFFLKLQSDFQRKTNSKFLLFLITLPELLSLVFRYRFLRAFYLLNPSLPFSVDSRQELLQFLNNGKKSVSAVFEKPYPVVQIKNFLQITGVKFPVLIQDDSIHARSQYVRLQTINQLEGALTLFHSKICISEILPEELELEVLFQMTEGSEGKILHIEKKIFPEVRGDGKSTLRSLVSSNPKLRFFEIVLFYQNETHWEKVLPAGEVFRLTYLGSQRFGTETKILSKKDFTDLESTLNEIFIHERKDLDLLRLKIRATSEENLRKGRFQILSRQPSFFPQYMISSSFSYFESADLLKKYWAWIFWKSNQRRSEGRIPPSYFSILSYFLRSLKSSRRKILRYDFHPPSAI